MKNRTVLSATARARLIDWLTAVLQPALVPERYAAVLENAHQRGPEPDEHVMFEVPGDYTRSGKPAVLSLSFAADFLSVEATVSVA